MRNEVRDQGLPKEEITSRCFPGGSILRCLRVLLPWQITLCAVVVGICSGGSVSADLADGQPSPVAPGPELGVRRAATGGFVVTLPGVEASIDGASVVGVYLSALEFVDKGRVSEALAALEGVEQRPLDFAAVMPSESECPEMDRVGATTPVVMELRRLHNQLCARLDTSHDEQIRSRLVRVCIGMPVRLATATPSELGNLVAAESMMSSAVRSLQDSLTQQHKLAIAGEVRTAGEAVEKHFRQQTAPLIQRYVTAALSIDEIAGKVGVNRSERCRMFSGLQETEGMLARRLTEGWLRPVRRLPPEFRPREQAK